MEIWEEILKIVKEIKKERRGVKGNEKAK